MSTAGHPGRWMKVLAAAALVAGLALAGCGDSDSSAQAGAQDEKPAAVTATAAAPSGVEIPEPAPGARRVCALVPPESLAQVLGVDVEAPITGAGTHTRDTYTRLYSSCTWTVLGGLNLTVEHSAEADYSNGTFTCEEWSHVGPATPPEPVGDLGVPATWAFYSDLKTEGKLRVCAHNNLIDVEIDRAGVLDGDDLKDQAVDVAELYVEALNR